MARATSVWGQSTELWPCLEMRFCGGQKNAAIAQILVYAKFKMSFWEKNQSELTG